MTSFEMTSTNSKSARSIAYIEGVKISSSFLFLKVAEKGGNINEQRMLDKVDEELS